MKTFTRNVGEIQLFDEVYTIVSTPLQLSVELDMIQDASVPKEHLELHKMLLVVESSLSINYKNYRFWKQPFQYFKNRKLKKMLSYKHLRNNIDASMLLELVLLIGELNKTEEQKKKVKKVKTKEKPLK